MPVNQKTQMTKQILAESLKKLMLHHSFEKITIKDITDAAGFIRPTFYNHFKDKYDLVEWIFTEEIIRPGEQLFDVGLFREGIRLMLANIHKPDQRQKPEIKTEKFLPHTRRFFAHSKWLHNPHIKTSDHV